MLKTLIFARPSVGFFCCAQSLLPDSPDKMTMTVNPMACFAY